MVLNVTQVALVPEAQSALRGVSRLTALQDLTLQCWVRSTKLRHTYLICMVQRLQSRHH